MVVTIKFENNSEKFIPMLGKKSQEKLVAILETLKDNPYNTKWEPIMRFEVLKYQKYRGLPIMSLRLSNRDRFCYSIEDNGNKIVIHIVSTKDHYTMLSHELAKPLNQIRALCDNKPRKIAFNSLVKSLLFTQDEMNS